MLESIGNVPAQFWAALCEMAPYLLLGFLAAGLMSVLIRPETVSRHLGGRGLMPVVKASAFGVPLPLCSCGVLPVAAGLRRAGAGRGATVAFLISTPQTGVDSILPTLGMLGPTMAIYRPIVALVSGVFGGVLTDALAGRGAAAGERVARGVAGGGGSCCEGGSAAAAPRGGWLRRAVWYGFGEMPRDMGAAMLVGLAIAALVAALTPPALFPKWLGGGVGSMLLMMAIGIPVYVCATASVPIAAAMIAAGASPGVALVFLMTGPATNAATVATVWKTMGWRTAVTYLASVALSALAAGLLLDLVYARTGAVAGPCLHLEVPGLVKSAMAVGLLGLLAAGALRKPKATEGQREGEKASSRSRLEGDRCESEEFVVPKGRCQSGPKCDASATGDR